MDHGPRLESNNRNVHRRKISIAVFPRFPWAPREARKTEGGFSWDVGHRFTSMEDILSIDRRKKQKKWKEREVRLWMRNLEALTQDSVHLRPAFALGDTPFRLDGSERVASTVCCDNCYLKFSGAVKFTFSSRFFPPSFATGPWKSVVKFNASLYTKIVSYRLVKNENTIVVSVCKYVTTT